MSQKAAKVWKGGSEQRFAQVSAFLPLGQAADEAAVMSFRRGIDTYLADAGVALPKDNSIWVDAYSAGSSVQVRGDRGAYAADVVAVGGEFFLFHPYELLSGSYLSPDDLMDDRVVLDNELAWKLFGGYDLAGMAVTINERPYYIAGVVRRETDGFSKQAFTGEPLLFMPYGAALELDGSLVIDAYELVAPDPITDFVKNLVNDNFAPDSAVVVQNSNRYGFGKIYGMLRNIGARAIADDGVIYPYWENAARISETYIARLYVYIALLGVLPMVTLVYLAVLLIKYLIGKLKHAAGQGKEAWDDRYARIEKIKEKRKRQQAQRQASAFDEKAVEFDIESIVKEIMEENE